MGWKSFFGFLFFLLVLFLLGGYWFFPLDSTDFIYLNSGYETSNFSESLEGNLTDSGLKVQFYENMRYPSNEISYSISKRCTLQKKGEMESALQILDDSTMINFRENSVNPEILISCQNKDKFDGDFFIAGEGGPTNITRAGDYNVILKGEILLIRDSKCERPNVALHELLHATGFEHSSNPKNIMYNISRCEQTLGEDTIDFINELYSIPSLPDLEFESASANMKGRYLNLNVSIRNNGLFKSEDSKIEILADNNSIKEIEVGDLDIGYGRTFILTDVFISQISVEKISFKIVGEEELKAENNFLELKVKNS